MKQKVRGFGLIIISSEVLCARRQDAHFATLQRMLMNHRLKLVYSMIVPDEPVVIDAQLAWAMARPEPFFCCGGIGNTPDDYTRQCVARVAGVGLELHPEGVRILKERFGDRATGDRLKMVEFPIGCELVPNPYNRIPGFSIRNGYFLPGFPEMAAPMSRWVVENLYETGDEEIRWTVMLPGAKEADLSPLMERIVAVHPDVSLSSLPMFTTAGTTQVELSLSGRPDLVKAAVVDMQRELDSAKVRSEPIT